MKRTREELIEVIENDTKLAKYFTKKAENDTELTEHFTERADMYTKTAKEAQKELDGDEG